MEGEVGLRKYVNEWLTLDKRECERMVDRLGWGGVDRRECRVDGESMKGSVGRGEDNFCLTMLLGQS